MSYRKQSFIIYGGDYNPDQWEEETMRRDMEYFHRARINTVVLPVFAWAKLEPSEGVYEFDWLDHILDVLDENGIHYILATPTVAQPAWMSLKYPEVLPVDIQGRKRTHGMRVYFCVNSVKYRERAAAIATAMADHFGTRPGLIGWHVANEYGTSCYCENCQRKFRTWLQKRYGTIEALNDKWNTVFWGRQVGSFEEVMLPTELNDDYRFCPAVELDYQRFKTDSTIECYENEARILKAHDPEKVVYTNISGFIKKLDQFRMVPHMDVAGFDNYPAPDAEPGLTAMKLDIMRAAKDGDSFFVAEQSPNQQNWQPYNKLKRPGEVRRLAFQGLAHGADSSMYFQMRQSKAGQEKFHGAMISRGGEGDTRIFGEMTQLGEELHRLGDRFIGARHKAKVGILFDWENWWALELCSGPSKDLDYLEEVHYYYEEFFRRNIAVDVLKYTADFDGYDLIVAPMIYMEKEDLAQRLSRFVRAGGTLLTTYMSGLADANDRCIYGAAPGLLQEVCGLWVEETDALYPGEQNVMRYEGREYPCSFLCDIVRPTSAKVLASYGLDFYEGTPALCVNAYGDGRAYYLASRPAKELLHELVGQIVEELHLQPTLPFTGNVEIDCRICDDGTETYFIINHGKEAAFVELQDRRCALTDLLSGEAVSGEIMIAGGDVKILGD